MPQNPRRESAQECVNPRTSKVPFLGVAPAWPAGCLHAINAVFVGGMVKP
jgi:hypothetical protein